MQIKPKGQCLCSLKFNPSGRVQDTIITITESSVIKGYKLKAVTLKAQHELTIEFVTSAFIAGGFSKYKSVNANNPLTYV